MPDEIIRIRNASYAEYEEMLMRRDEYSKEAFLIQQKYIRTFGQLILDVFKLKIECIRKKKTIEYCQAFINRGESIDHDALRDFLKKEMEEYNARLDRMIRDHENAKDTQRITEADRLEIKRIYHRMVKKLHPDVNPLVKESHELGELWLKLTIAYKCNDLKSMKETEILINAYIDKNGPEYSEIEIPDIEDKIKEVKEETEKIKSTDPYQYKYLLEDPEAVELKKTELKNELKEYEDHSKELETILTGYAAKGVTFTWRMN